MSGGEWWDFYTGRVPAHPGQVPQPHTTTKAQVVDWGEDMDARQYDARGWSIEELPAGYHTEAPIRRMDGEEAPVIGIMGDIGSGKSSVAKMLMGVEFKELSFAAPLKDLCIDLFGLKHRHCYGTQEDKTEPQHHLGPVPDKLRKLGAPWIERSGKTWTPRWILEYAGTEFGRTIYGDVWVDRAFAKTRCIVGDVDVTEQLGSRWVVSDVRFRNEAAAIKKRGGQLWRIGIMDEEGREKAGDMGKTGHQSDNEWRTIVPDVHFLAQRGELPALEFEVLKVLSLAGL